MDTISATNILFNISGIVVAVKGVEEETKPGFFKVDEICFPDLDIPPAIASAPDW